MSVSLDCSICGKSIKTSACPHPWNKGFDDWPKRQLDEVLALFVKPSKP